MEITDFEPRRINKKYITFLVELTECHICKRDMIDRPKRPSPPFPFWNKINFDVQVAKAGLVVKSGILVDDHYICNECAKNGRADFLCALCKDRKKTYKIELSIGDPPEFLCVDCFNRVTAAEWGKMVELLEEAHKYDSVY